MNAAAAARGEVAACYERLATRLAGVPGIHLKRNEPLHRYTSFRVGGVADWFASPESAEALSALMRIAWEEGCPVTVLGGGSNLLIADEGIRGLVVRIGRPFSRITWQEHRVFAEAGATLPAVAKQAAERGLSGLEFAAGIPGTLGGAVVMNAGAHDGDMASVVRSVRTVSRRGEFVTFSRDECRFRYRGSRFLDAPEWIVVGAELELTPGDPRQIREKMERYLYRRRSTQPLNTRNAGSIFKNPPGDFAGRLIEQAGCKGWREGGAQVSERHANFIVNTGRATAADIWRLVERVRQRVYERFGVALELEVGVLGFQSSGNGIEEVERG